jgi:hypothetical protein
MIFEGSVEGYYTVVLLNLGNNSDNLLVGGPELQCVFEFLSYRARLNCPRMFTLVVTFCLGEKNNITAIEHVGY